MPFRAARTILDPAGRFLEVAWNIADQLTYGKVVVRIEWLAKSRLPEA